MFIIPFRPSRLARSVHVYNSVSPGQSHHRIRYRLFPPLHLRAHRLKPPIAPVTNPSHAIGATQAHHGLPRHI